MNKLCAINLHHRNHIYLDFFAFFDSKVNDVETKEDSNGNLICFFSPKPHLNIYQFDFFLAIF